MKDIIKKTGKLSVRLFWILIYSLGVLFTSMLLLTLIPKICAYLYAYIGATMGLNFKSVSNGDIAFWAMCCMTTSIIFVPFIIKGIQKMLHKWNDMVLKRIRKRGNEDDLQS